MRVVMLAEESEGCLSLLLEWRIWAALFFFWSLASMAWDILKAVSSPTPRLRYKARIRVRRAIGKPKGGAR